MADDPRMGRPGLPGEPGERGRRGGGAGGAGGTGGAGGHAGVSHAAYWAIVCAVIVVAFLSSVVIWNTVRIQKSVNKANAAAITALHSITLARQAEDRLCIRQMVTRAVINNHLAHDRDHIADLPIYDCSPNVRGGAARLLTPVQTAEYQALIGRRPQP